MSLTENRPCDCGEFVDDLPPKVIHCFSHHANETTDGCYIVCFECKHVYATAQDLVDAYNRESQRSDGLAAAHPEWELDTTPIPLKTLADVYSIYFCQECLHDF